MCLVSLLLCGDFNKAYDAAINDLDEVAEQQAGRHNKIDDLMTEAEQVYTGVLNSDW